MPMCACKKEHMREVIDYVFYALCMVCLGRAVSWNRRDCNECKILEDWDDCVKVLGHESSFPNRRFIDSGRH